MCAPAYRRHKPCSPLTQFDTVASLRPEQNGAQHACIITAKTLTLVK